jgi:hypothetical protein
MKFAGAGRFLFVVAYNIIVIITINLVLINNRTSNKQQHCLF